MKKTLVSFVVPVLNEQGNVQKCYDAILAVMKKLRDQYNFEIVFTDNHSSDNTYQILENLGKNDPRVRVARFKQNYGFNRSLLTGYRLAQGDVALQLDYDLQDPPELLCIFLEYWKKGHDVVVGVRRTRKERKLLLLSRKLFYRLLSKITEDDIVVDGGDFRLVDKSVLDQLRTLHEATPFVRGLISTLARNQIGIAYDRMERTSDNSKFPVPRLFRLAIDGIISHSVLPLRIASWAGIVTSAATIVLALFYICGKLFLGFEWPAGFATEVVLILFGISLNAIFLGIIGEYISRIYVQLSNRPTTIIRNSINLTKALNSASPIDDQRI